MVWGRSTGRGGFAVGQVPVHEPCARAEGAFSSYLPSRP